MKNRLIHIRNHPVAGSYLRLCILMMTACLMSVTSCASLSRQLQFDPGTCLNSVPNHIKGLRIVQGERTEKSIIRDMLPAICNSQMLFRTMQARDAVLEDGRVVFRVMVEYTGEVKNVTVHETTVRSEDFLRRVSGMIENSDFVGWARDDTDTIFLYPVDFRTP